MIVLDSSLKWNNAWLLNILACFSESRDVNKAERTISCLSDKSRPEASSELDRMSSLRKRDSRRRDLDKRTL
jgi:hypothetical protein